MYIQKEIAVLILEMRQTASVIKKYQNKLEFDQASPIFKLYNHTRWQLTSWFGQQVEKESHILVCDHGERSMILFSVSDASKRHETGLRVAGIWMALLREIYLRIMG